MCLRKTRFADGWVESLKAARSAVNAALGLERGGEFLSAESTLKLK